MSESTKHTVFSRKNPNRLWNWYSPNRYGFLSINGVTRDIGGKFGRFRQGGYSVVRYYKPFHKLAVYERTILLAMAYIEYILDGCMRRRIARNIRLWASKHERRS